jgi:hypothetical protein
LFDQNLVASTGITGTRYATVIKCYDLEMSGKVRRLGVPVVRIAAQTPYHDDRRSLSVNLIINIQAIQLAVGHTKLLHILWKKSEKDSAEVV